MHVSSNPNQNHYCRSAETTAGAARCKTAAREASSAFLASRAKASTMQKREPEWSTKNLCIGSSILSGLPGGNGGLNDSDWSACSKVSHDTSSMCPWFRQHTATHSGKVVALLFPTPIRAEAATHNFATSIDD
eukprot:INCI5372.3.p1 GENE.INCI5372.3~~INCI5372.3.p1  ORF type:complete len:133 (+),score=21.68 INCI5372.3:230-628(+)